MTSDDQREPTADEAAGIAWWNSLSADDRATWAAKVGTGVAADAWAAFKASSMDGMSQANPPFALVEDELAQPRPRAPTPPMGTILFTATQGPEDLERLRKAYEITPLLPGKTA